MAGCARPPNPSLSLFSRLKDNWSGNLTQLQYLPAPLIFADAQRDDDDYDCDAAVNSIHSLHVLLAVRSTHKKITENKMAEASAKAAAAAPAKKGDRRASRKSSIFTKARMSFVR